jgi:hypothetical protein
MDPYISIWEGAPHEQTMHWTGTPVAIVGMLRLDTLGDTVEADTNAKNSTVSSSSTADSISTSLTADPISTSLTADSISSSSTADSISSSSTADSISSSLTADSISSSSSAGSISSSSRSSASSPTSSSSCYTFLGKPPDSCKETLPRVGQPKVDATTTTYNFRTPDGAWEVGLKFVTPGFLKDYDGSPGSWLDLLSLPLTHVSVAVSRKDVEEEVAVRSWKYLIYPQ